MGVAALLRRVDLPVDMVVFLLHRTHLPVIDTDAAGTEDSQLAVVHVGDVAGIADQRRHVGGDVVAVLAEAQQQRGVLPGGVHPVGVVGAHDAQSVGSVHRVEHAHDRLEEVAALFVVVVQQLGHHLRVGIGPEGIALLNQLIFQLHVVLNDAVVHHGDPPAAADVGVGVDVVGLAVGGPAGVSDAQGAGQIGAVVGQLAEHVQPAADLLHPQLTVTAHSNAGGVIAPVFQSAQAVQQNGGRLLRANISYDSTHILDPPDNEKWYQKDKLADICLFSPVTASLFCGRPHICQPRYAPGTARESFRRRLRFSLLLVVLPIGAGAGAS